MISTLNENSEINIADSNGELRREIIHVGMKHLSPQWGEQLLLAHRFDSEPLKKKNSCRWSAVSAVFRFPFISSQKIHGPQTSLENVD